ncbi:MAG: hypothetical protein ACRDPW_00680 [Mycobacteriales bacterium]
MQTLTSVRVTSDQREQLKKIATEDYGGVSAAETIERLMSEHFEARCIDQMSAVRQDRAQWADYKAELATWTRVQAPVVE